MEAEFSWTDETLSSATWRPEPRLATISAEYEKGYCSFRSGAMNSCAE
jgi:hypothetical protein